jgi:hypothetical protein
MAMFWESSRTLVTDCDLSIVEAPVKTVSDDRSCILARNENVTHPADTHEDDLLEVNMPPHCMLSLVLPSVNPVHVDENTSSVGHDLVTDTVRIIITAESIALGYGEITMLGTVTDGRNHVGSGVGASLGTGAAPCGFSILDFEEDASLSTDASPDGPEILGPGVGASLGTGTVYDGSFICIGLSDIDCIYLVPCRASSHTGCIIQAHVRQASRAITVHDEELDNDGGILTKSLTLIADDDPIYDAPVFEASFDQLHACSESFDLLADYPEAMICCRDAPNNDASVCTQIKTHRKAINSLRTCIESAPLYGKYDVDNLHGGGVTRCITSDTTVPVTDSTVQGGGGAQPVIDSTAQGGGGTNQSPSLVSFSNLQFVWKLIDWENGESSTVSLDLNTVHALAIIGMDFFAWCQVVSPIEILPTDAPT